MRFDPFDPRQLEEDELLKQLGQPPRGPDGVDPPNTTMPVPVDNPRDPRWTSVNAPRLTQANGRWTLSEHGNQRPLQDNEVANARGYVSDFWKKFPTGFQPDNPNSLNDAYRQFLGRDPDAEGLAAHAQNPGGFAGAINTIAMSPEAAAYGARAARAPDSETTTGTTSAPPVQNLDYWSARGVPASDIFDTATGQLKPGWRRTALGYERDGPPTGPPAGSPGGTRRGWNNLNLMAPTQRHLNQFGGFNLDRALAGGDEKSVKDAFARWAGGLDFDLRGKTKEQIGDYFRSQVGSAKEYGLNILDVKGDKMLIETKERGPEWIDFVADAGGTNPVFAWQSDFDTQGQAALEPTGTASRITPPPAAAGMARAPDAAQSAPVPGTDDALARIIAEIQALMTGGASPLDAEALQRLLR